jgi:hypothetical protein
VHDRVLFAIFGPASEHDHTAIVWLGPDQVEKYFEIDVGGAKDMLLLARPSDIGRVNHHVDRMSPQKIQNRIAVPQIKLSVRRRNNIMRMPELLNNIFSNKSAAAG